MSIDKKLDIASEPVPYVRELPPGQGVEVGESIRYPSIASATEALGGQRSWARVRLLIGGALALGGSAAIGVAIYERSDNVIAAAAATGIVFVYGLYNAANEGARILAEGIAIRAGDIVGDHTVILAGPSERLELTHRAHNRDVFARGALKAAQFVVNQKPGLYDMSHVLKSVS